MTKEELIRDIRNCISEYKKQTAGAFTSEQSDATNRVAISNLYIALSNLIKEQIL